MRLTPFRSALLRLAVLAVTVLFFAVAGEKVVAQDAAPVWKAGERLSFGDGGLELISEDQERTFTLGNSGKELKFRFLRLSGEREHRLQFTEETERSQTFRGDGTRLTITAFSPETIVAEFETSGEARGLAFLEVTSNEEITTGTLAVDSQGIYFQTPEASIYVRAAGAQAFRDKLEKGYRIVLALDQRMRVRIAVSTDPIEEADLEMMKLSDAKPVSDDHDGVVSNKRTVDIATNSRVRLYTWSES